MESDEKDKGKEDLSRTAGLPLIYSNAMDRDTLIAASRSRCSVDREDGIARGRERRGWALEMGSHSAPPSADGGRRRLHTWYMYLTSQPTTPVSYKVFIDSSAHTGRRHAAHHRALILPFTSVNNYRYLAGLVGLHGDFATSYMYLLPCCRYSGTCMLSRFLGPWRP